MDSLILLAAIDRALDEPVREIELFTDPYYSPYYSLMYYLMKELAPDVCALELGVEKGRGLFSMAQAKTDHPIYGFDTHPTAEAGTVAEMFSNVHYEEHAALPATTLPLPIGLLHVDTEHSYATAKAEFNGYKPQLAPGAVVLFDDTHAQEGGVLSFVRTLPYFKVFVDRLHPVCGYAVLLYE